ncbi:MAG: SMC-Scp complex subunit ScpB [Kiritimatiellia bacterium]
MTFDILRGMNDDVQLPEPKSLQSVIGAMLFAADHPLTIEELRKSLKAQGEVAMPNSFAAQFAQATSRQIGEFLEDIASTLNHIDLGLRLYEEDGHFSLRTMPGTGPWIRTLLKVETAQRLSRAGLETLAIIAYRQPISRAELESVRGVSADHTLHALLELNLIRAIGRSELPGRPFLYGTTATFLEHFGLKNIQELSLPFTEEVSAD